MPRARLATGDIFTIPLDDERFVVGQIAGRYLNDGSYLVVSDAPVT